MSELLTKIGIIDLDEGHDNSPKGQMGYYDKSVLYSYDDICNRLTCDIDVNSTASDTASFRTKALWDTGASMSCISEKLVQRMGIVPVDTGMAVSVIGKKTVSYYIVNAQLAPGMVFRHLKVACLPMMDHDVDFIIGMDMISEGNFNLINSDGKTTLTYFKADEKE